MAKLIFSGDKLAAVVLEGGEIQTVEVALAYTLATATEDVPTVRELLAELQTPAPKPSALGYLANDAGSKAWKEGK